MARRGSDSDPIVEDAIRRTQERGGMRRRPGRRSGAYGVTYLAGGYYLSPEQFGYTTAQAYGGSGGGEMTTTGTSGGDSGGSST